ncbi:glycosyl hydrolase family 18 protein [Edwardsiella anguillarum]|uniref:Glycosyl hydrolase family 18 protein n=1 Tax=Edwardsiella anguillarum TaxID=1821960 RepID=A0ABY8SL48_9GAMM|nr:glycosyl hydrolase family 18 protein [Edwardsiella anguillarum]UOU80803.1 glycosyl hydrolase family 18 protein [Edwardsiella anguillarum]WHP85548.1 glycosyl hydrolase family 18 protein [Edwardsiella anguillarum]WHP89330.1 glycosyl hydrolase family 18 protein [Edwardsiella anguillarum]WHP93130.1 glycosyl hydrolase family 18 protein [Edwardsiella anguillarum]WHP96936.1 glycosyl hydrolase family 18 protein [Edwardsiella anguillarum]
MQKINYNWGVTTHIQFDPATDRLDFGWMQSSEFSISESDGSVVISISGNEQYYILDGVSLADMQISGISALDDSAVAVWSEAITNAGGSSEPAASVAPVVAPPVSDVAVVPAAPAADSVPAPITEPEAVPAPQPESAESGGPAPAVSGESTVTQIAYNWGATTHLQFNPATDRLDFGWMQGSEFSISEENGSVVIAINGNQQSYILDGVSLADMDMSDISALDSSAISAWSAAIFNAGGSSEPAAPVAPVVAPPVADIAAVPAADSVPAPVTVPEAVPAPQPESVGSSDPAPAVSGKSTVIQIAYNWGSTTHLQFNPATDRLDFGWMQGGEFSISEENGSVVIAIDGNQQSYILDGVSLADMDMSDISALDSSAISAWSAAIFNAGGNGEIIPVSSAPAGSSSGSPASTVPSDYTVMPRDGSSYEFTPYVDMTAWPTPDLLAISQQSGASEFTLAFMVSDGVGGLSWGGVVPVATETDFAGGIAAFRKAGGRVTLSFGGANGTEAAIGASSAEELAALYQSAIDKYQVDSIDFDIEGAALNDKKSVDMRNQAIAILGANNPNLEVSYTLPVLPDGLTLDGMNLLQSAVDNHARIDIVNVMAMDYGGAYDRLHNNRPDMGDAAISAANATLSQMRSVGLVDSKVGITPMIGVNDVNVEIFNLEDATELVAYAEGNPDVGRLSMWSIGRDNGSGAGHQWASSSFSGLQQGSYDFARLLGGSGADAMVPVSTPDQGAVSPDSSVTALETTLVVPVEPAVDAAAPGTAPSDYTVMPRDGSSYEFAPYVDMTAWPTPDLLAISQQSGASEFTLAFMVSDGVGGLSWGGVVPVATETDFAGGIAAFRQAGGRVTLSFGGANGTEAAIGASSAEELAALYQSAIDKYQVDSIDFDIEGAALNDKKSVDMRNQAIAILGANNPNLKVSYTLPVLPDGLTLDGMNLLQSAVDNHARIDIVNVMAMDYGGAYDRLHNNRPDMGDAAISAANATLSQMRSVGLVDSKVGITPMIGVNDVNVEIFNLEDATELVAYAEGNPDVGRLSMWSIGRDNGSGAGQQWASSSASGLQQGSYDFARLLGGSGADAMVPVSTPDQGAVSPDSSVTALESALVAPVEPAVDAAAPGTAPSNYTVMQEMTILESNNPMLDVSYTLPVLPAGLNLDGGNLLQSAVDSHARIDIVNIMAMDYGGAYDSLHNNSPDMEDTAISAANSTLSQMHDIGMDGSGTTPMIGVNDDSNEIFTLADAAELADYADSNADIGRSIGQDNGTASDQSWATSLARGLEQSDHDFAKAFAG